MKLVWIYMKRRFLADLKRRVICRLSEHLSNSVEQDDCHYENWKRGMARTLGLDTDSRVLCSGAKVEKKAVAQERHGMIVRIYFF
jgi:hypothetical protein